MLVQLKNDAGLVRQVKVGFSWTTFFFGGFVFFFRGMSTHGMIWVLLTLVTMGFSNLFLMFMINKMTAHYYLEHGYKTVGEGWNVAGSKWGIAAEATA